MQALKWFGYLVAASVVLAVIAGIGLTVFTVVVIGGAFIGALSLVMGLASIIKRLLESAGPPG